MAKTLHTNVKDFSGRVYCFKTDTITSLDKISPVCQNCPYFYDTAGMMGVQCEFDDSCDEGAIVFDDPAESERHSKMVLKRLGLKTEKEVDRMLSGMGAENEKHLEGGEILPEEREKASA